MQVCPANVCSRQSPKIMSQSIEFLPVQYSRVERKKRMCYDSVKLFMQSAKHGDLHAVGTQQMIAMITIT